MIDEFIFNEMNNIAANARSLKIPESLAKYSNITVISNKVAGGVIGSSNIELKLQNLNSEVKKIGKSIKEIFGNCTCSYYELRNVFRCICSKRKFC